MKPFNTTKLLVAGDVMLDRYWIGDTERISPEAPVPVVRVTRQEDRPGGAANVALNLAALKAGVSLIGITGIDSDSEILKDILLKADVDPVFYRSSRVPTITKIRVMSRNQQLIRMDAEESLITDAEALMLPYSSALKSSDLVILSDYAKGTLSRAQDMIQLAKKAGKKVLVDPKGTDFSLYRGATLLTPNLSEFEAVAGTCKTNQCIERKGAALIEMLDLDALLVTLSEKGMILIQRSEPALCLPAHAHEVYDVTGAGDTVIAVLGLALAAGADYPEAVELANTAAGIVVCKPGTATLTESELFDQP